MFRFIFSILAHRSFALRILQKILAVFHSFLCGSQGATAVDTDHPQTLRDQCQEAIDWLIEKFFESTNFFLKWIGLNNDTSCKLQYL